MKWRALEALALDRGQNEADLIERLTDDAIAEAARWSNQDIWLEAMTEVVLSLDEGKAAEVASRASARHLYREQNRKRRRYREVVTDPQSGAFELMSVDNPFMPEPLSDVEVDRRIEALRLTKRQREATDLYASVGCSRVAVRELVGPVEERKIFALVSKVRRKAKKL